MSLDAIMVLVLLGVALVLFITEWIATDMVAFLVMLGLMLSGILTLEEGFSGFSNPATIAIASMLVLSSAIEETGVLTVLHDAIERLAERSRTLASLSFFFGVGITSAFINNTAVVALFIPLSISLAPRLGMSRRRLLMSLSFVSIFGGMLTLIGTSTNLLISGLAVQQGFAPLSMFELAPVGAVLFVVGLVYIRFAGRSVLDEEETPLQLTERFEMQDHLVELEITREFSGDAVADLEVLEELDVDLLELRHDDAVLPLDEETHLEAGDILRVRGNVVDLEEVLEREGLILHEGHRWTDLDFAQSGHILAEVVVIWGSKLTSRRLGDLHFPARFGATVLAVRQGSRLEQDALDEVELAAGDAILLKLPAERILELQHNPALVVVSSYNPRPPGYRLPIVLLIMAGVVLASALELLPVALAAMAGCFVLVATQCLTMNKAYKAIPWKIVMLVAGLIPLGLAMEKTGAAQLLAEGALGLVEGLGPRVQLGILFLLTSILTNVMSNAASAVVCTPIALSMAATLGIDARPLLITITFGASLSFMTPIGYQTNTLIYGLGDFRFLDFFKVGTPLTLLCTLTVVGLVPVFWPL